MEFSFGTVALVIFIVALVFVFKTINVVPQQHAWVVERLGKYHATLATGLNIVVPFIDRVAYKHSLKEIPLDVPPKVCITKDNTQLQVDGILYFQVTDAHRELVIDAQSEVSVLEPRYDEDALAQGGQGLAQLGG